MTPRGLPRREDDSVTHGRGSHICFMGLGSWEHTGVAWYGTWEKLIWKHDGSSNSKCRARCLVKEDREGTAGGGATSGWLQNLFVERAEGSLSIVLLSP